MISFYIAFLCSRSFVRLLSSSGGGGGVVVVVGVASPACLLKSLRNEVHNANAVVRGPV
jgi:hypothetical protein